MGWGDSPHGYDKDEWQFYIKFNPKTIVKYKAFLTHWSRVTHICASILTNHHWLTQWLVAWFLVEIHTFFIQQNAIENIMWRMATIFVWLQCVK